MKHRIKRAIKTGIGFEIWANNKENIYLFYLSKMYFSILALSPLKSYQLKK